MRHMVAVLSIRIHVAPSKLQNNTVDDSNGAFWSTVVKMAKAAKRLQGDEEGEAWAHQLSTPTLPMEQENIVKRQ